MKLGNSSADSAAGLFLRIPLIYGRPLRGIEMTVLFVVHEHPPPVS